ncbi:L-2-hydroxyglutarate dehydrogenase [Populus alba x Populus x berolinensis]|nr:L-2-hydroxyglutarate dehydrogenase [Populus alba x Populus x berolinensis]
MTYDRHITRTENFRFRREGQERKMLPRLKQTLQSLKRTATISKAQAIKNLSTQIKKEDVPTEKLDCVVIGAGVVGIAIARELASIGREVLVLDSASTFGTGTSSRNSEVIHAGIYYPPDSLKVGKLIVATGPLEISKLNELMNRGTQNGVDNLKMLEGFEAMKMEPELQCKKALLSPVSGIGEAENNGTTFSYNSTVIGGHLEGNCLHLYIVESKDLENWNGDYPLHPELVLVPKLVVNSAGLRFFARGCYFTLSSTKVPLFEHLIYPIPEDGGLGVHVTLDLDGQLKFGPMLNGLMA